MCARLLSTPDKRTPGCARAGLSLLSWPSSNDQKKRPAVQGVNQGVQSLLND